MSIHHQVQQGSSAWLELRAGIPTASDFESIVTPTGKISSAQERYLHTLLAERIMQRPTVEHVSMWMERGSQMEEEAVEFYELQRDIETVPVGFVTNDARTIGASPDRLVGDDGLLEIKCPAEHTHVGYLLFKSVDRKYYPQLQGQLWITGRQWVDILSYHPVMPPALVHVERDAEYIKLLADEVEKFSARLEAKAAELVERGLIKDNVEPIPPTLELLDVL